VLRNILFILPAENFNETEFLVTKKKFEDHAFKIFIASDANALCKGKNGLKVKADVKLYNVHASNFDAVVLIGGSGVKNYRNNETVHKIFIDFLNKGKIASAICSAPLVLAHAGLLSGKAATCYADDKDELVSEGAVYMDKPVVKTGKIITGQNSTASADFAKLVIDSI
jgi:protease I